MPACLEHFSRCSSCSSCLSWHVSPTTQGFNLNATKLSTWIIAVRRLITAGTSSSLSMSPLMSGLGSTGSLSLVDARHVTSSLSTSANAWRDTSPMTVWMSGLRDGRSKSRDGWSKSRDGRSKSRDGWSKSRDGRSKSRDGRSKSRDGRSKSRDGWSTSLATATQIVQQHKQKALHYF